MPDEVLAPVVEETAATEGSTAPARIRT
ncbi:MAG: hypothetical protein QOK30_1958, partial [Nocardioidaceae bacterium]|nr:hypothetical protein [Nocardioidaceae bacterium]